MQSFGADLSLSLSLSLPPRPRCVCSRAPRARVRARNHPEATVESVTSARVLWAACMPCTASYSFHNIRLGLTSSTACRLADVAVLLLAIESLADLARLADHVIH